MGNCSTETIEKTIRKHHADIQAFVADNEQSLMALG